MSAAFSEFQFGQLQPFFGNSNPLGAFATGLDRLEVADCILLFALRPERPSAPAFTSTVGTGRDSRLPQKAACFFDPLPCSQNLAITLERLLNKLLHAGGRCSLRLDQKLRPPQ